MKKAAGAPKKAAKPAASKPKGAGGAGGAAASQFEEYSEPPFKINLSLIDTVSEYIKSGQFDYSNYKYMESYK